MATSLRTGMRQSAETSVVAMVTPAEGPSLGMAPSGTWTWMSMRLEEAPLQPERLGAAAHVAHGRLRRLLHDVAELAGDGELALARHHGGLHREELAAELGPGQAGGQADAVLLLGGAVAEARRPEEALHGLGVTT